MNVHSSDYSNSNSSSQHSLGNCYTPAFYVWEISPHHRHMCAPCPVT